MSTNGAVNRIPDHVKQVLAAKVIEAQVARETARNCVEVICLVYGLDPQSVVRVLGDLVEPPSDGPSATGMPEGTEG